jgi:hypothetical protein
LRRGRHEHHGVALDQELLQMTGHFVTSPDALRCFSPLSSRLNGVIRTELPSTEETGYGCVGGELGMIFLLEFIYARGIPKGTRF